MSFCLKEPNRVEIHKSHYLHILACSCSSNYAHLGASFDVAGDTFQHWLKGSIIEKGKVFEHDLAVLGPFVFGWCSQWVVSFGELPSIVFHFQVRVLEYSLYGGHITL